MDHAGQEEVNVRGNRGSSEQSGGLESKDSDTDAGQPARPKGVRRPKNPRPGGLNGKRQRRSYAHPYSEAYQEEKVLKRFRVRIGKSRSCYCDGYTWQPPWLTIINGHDKRVVCLTDGEFTISDLLPPTARFENTGITPSPMNTAIQWNAAPANGEPVATGGLADLKRKALERMQSLGPTFGPVEDQ